MTTTQTSSPATVSAPERGRGLLLGGLAVAVVAALGTTLVAAVLRRSVSTSSCPTAGSRSR